VVVKPIEGLSLFALESTTFNAASGGGQTLANGAFPSNPEGKDREVGFKTELFGSRLTSNFSVFENSITGATRAVVRADGSIYLVPIPGDQTKTNGWDMNFGVSPISGLQVLGSYSKYTQHTLLYDLPTSSWSVFADYKLPEDSPLRGLAIGGGAYHYDGRYTGIAYYVYADKTPFELLSGLKECKDTGTPVKVYATYRCNRHLNLRLSIDNLLDEAYAFGGGQVTTATAAMPRTFTFDAVYKF